MLLARVCKATISPQVSSLLKTPVVNVSKVQVTRLFGNEGRSTFSRTARNRVSLVEDAVRPAGETGTIQVYQIILVLMNFALLFIVIISGYASTPIFFFYVKILWYICWKSCNSSKAGETDRIQDYVIIIKVFMNFVPLWS